MSRDSWIASKNLSLLLFYGWCWIVEFGFIFFLVFCLPEFIEVIIIEICLAIKTGINLKLIVYSNISKHLNLSFSKELRPSYLFCLFHSSLLRIFPSFFVCSFLAKKKFSRIKKCIYTTKLSPFKANIGD